MVPILSGLIAGRGERVGAWRGVLAVAGVRARERGGVHHRRHSRGPARRGGEPAGVDAERVGARRVRAVVRRVVAVDVRAVRIAVAGGPARAAGRGERSPARRFVGRCRGDGRVVGVDRRAVRRAAADGRGALHRAGARSGVRRRGVVPARAGHGRAADRVRHRRGARHADERAVDDRGAARVRFRVPRAGDLDVVARVARRVDAGVVGPARARRGGVGVHARQPRRARGWRRVSPDSCSASWARRNCSVRSPVRTIRCSRSPALRGAQDGSDRVQAHQVGRGSRSRDRRRARAPASR